MTDDRDRLSVFISSRMAELTDLRAVIHRELLRLGIDAFVYEAVQGALPEDAESASLRMVSRCDVFVLILGESWGEITEREYDKARVLLESAVRAMPSFAAAHENLGDIYARLAAVSFEKAIKLDAANKTAPAKLKAVNELLPGGKR